MALATAWFRMRSGRAYRARARDARRASPRRSPRTSPACASLQSFTRERARAAATSAKSATATALANHADRRPERRSTSRSSTSSRRPRRRSCSATAAGSHFNGDVTIGTLFAFLLYLANFFDPVQQLSQLYNTFLSAVAALDKIIDVMDEEPEVVDRRARPTLTRIRGDVAFDGVRFAYGRGPGGAARDRPRRRRRARRSRSSATPAPASRRSRSCSRASTTRPKAASRSTASTCATSTQESLRRQLGIVPQEGFLFAGTVAENIAFGRPEATRRGDRRRDRAVGADEFVDAARGRLRDAARRARLAALARTATAGRVRARAARRSADPDPRRGDELGRHRHGADDRAGAAPACCTAGRRSSSRTGSRRSATPT